MDERKFPKVPVTWEELEALGEYLRTCSAWFLRIRIDQDKYTDDMNKVDRSEMLRRIRVQMEGKSRALVANKYPHTNILQNFPNALHYCLWNNDGPLTDDEIKSIVDKKFTDEKWFSMERKSAYRSIPEIWHCHIYINRKGI